MTFIYPSIIIEEKVGFYAGGQAHAAAEIKWRKYFLERRKSCSEQKRN